MDNWQIPSRAGIRFASASEAGTRIAGVAAAARIVRELAEAGVAEVWLVVPHGERIADRTLDDLSRLAVRISVRIGEPPNVAEVCWLPGDRLIPAPLLGAFLTGDPAAAGGALPLDRPARATAEILRATAKASDGSVSRWLNRPVSRRLSAVLLLIPGFKPNHATIGTGIITLLMFAALIGGGDWGLIAGGLLFHAASVFDGVDGEVARATFRTSRGGAVLDSIVDVATNVLLIVGLAYNLAWQGEVYASALAGWGLVLFVLGLAIIGSRSARNSGPFNFDQVKRHYRGRFGGALIPALIAFLTAVSSRDFFALLFAALIVAGFPMGVLYLFASAATVWIMFVAGSGPPAGKADLASDNA